MVRYIRTTIELTPWEHAQAKAEAKALGRSMASLLGERITRNAIKAGITRLPVFVDPTTGKPTLDMQRGKGLTVDEEARLIADYERRFPDGRRLSTSTKNAGAVSTDFG